MFDLIYSKLTDPQFILSMLVAIAAAATVLTVALPLIDRDPLKSRMKAVADERERMRERERRAMGAKGSLRQAPKVYMKSIVEQFNLSNWLGTGKAKSQLQRAGFRGSQAEISFLFFRLVTPIALFIFAAFYIFVVIKWDKPAGIRIGACVAAAYIGIKIPEFFLTNLIQKRQQSMSRAYPNALDLLLICVESGMSIEHAFRKVSQEIGSESVPMAEELALVTAELSYLPDRRQAYENLGIRTGLESVRSLSTVLIQAERYGTPLGTALRVMAQESRDARMNEAEKKAAALPPKLTVPMIVFNLPVLFCVILMPALIQVFKWK